MSKLRDLIKEVLLEKKKADRCLRIARRKIKKIKLKLHTGAVVYLDMLNYLV